LARAVTWALMPVSLQRRGVLAFLGFRFDAQRGLWRRGAVTLSDEALDAMPPRIFTQRVSRWWQGKEHTSTP
jgi:hypothetical protein